AWTRPRGAAGTGGAEKRCAGEGVRPVATPPARAGRFEVLADRRAAGAAMPALSNPWEPARRRVPTDEAARPRHAALGRRCGARAERRPDLVTAAAARPGFRLRLPGAPARPFRCLRPVLRGAGPPPMPPGRRPARLS